VSPDQIWVPLLSQRRDNHLINVNQGQNRNKEKAQIFGIDHKKKHRKKGTGGSAIQNVKIFCGKTIV